MTRRALRVCFVWPGGGAEHEYFEFAEATGDRVRVFLAPSRVGGAPGEDHDVSALEATARIDWILEAARRHTRLRPDVVYWACTSGSFVRGRTHAEAQVAAIESALGVAAGSTSLGFAAALAALECRRVSVLATYPDPAARAFESFLAEFDVEVVRLTSLGVKSGWDAAALDRDLILRQSCSAFAVGSDALLVPDTALPTLDVVEQIEREIGRPVLSANAVTLWHALQLGRRGLSVEGHGRLLARPPRLPVPG
ncbi:MAG: maleate cis-trans isomerase family protein [Gammaproteobacteria bacterium]